MDDVFEPTPIRADEPIPPHGGWFRRSCRAVFVQRRLPTRVREAFDRTLTRVGWRTKLLRVEGFQVRVRRLEADEHYVQEVISQRAYEAPGYEIGETDTVIDVGANIGAFALRAGSQACRGRILTIEPVEANFRLLCDNLRRNRLAHATPIRAAVAGMPTREATIHLSRLGSGHHSLLRPLAGDAPRSETVEAVRLFDLLERCGIEFCDFLKLDCEGAEYEIFAQMPVEVARRIRRVAMEYHTHGDLPKREQAGRLIEHLLRLGFQIDHYTDVQGTPRGMIFACRTFVSRSTQAAATRPAPDLR